jgi:NTE family protein
MPPSLLAHALPGVCAPCPAVWRRGPRWLAGLLLALVSCLLPGVAQADAGSGPPGLQGAAGAAPATLSTRPQGPPGPRIALVLSGGGARGFAHIGVLRVLHEARIPVHAVWGTSMGAVIGGAYAAGRTPDELVELVQTTDWDAVLADRPPREALSARRREEDLVLPSRVEFALGLDGLTLPLATAGNSRLELALARLLPEGMHDRASNALPIPFGSVASDLLTGELVDQANMPVFQALRASLSVPGVFAPVRVGSRLLADGGLVRNLPVDLARAAGAELIIAVNVGTPLGPESELVSSLGVARQMLAILTEQNVMRSLSELAPGDILVAPDLSGVSFMDFKSYTRAMAAGEAAARRVIDRLRALALPPDAYAAHLAERQRARAAAAPQARLPLGRLQIQGQQRIDPRTLVARLGIQPEQPVGTQEVHEAAARLQGHGDLSSVSVDIQDRDGRRDVRLQVTESQWARSRLRLGLELASDFADASSFGVAAMHVASGFNRTGTELRTTARIGTLRQLEVEVWQPLATASPWFGTASLGHLAGPRDAFADGRRLGRLYVRDSELRLGVGSQIGDWGEARLSVVRGLSSVRELLPEEGPVRSVYDSQLVMSLRRDTLDSLGYPTRGSLISLVWGVPLGERDGPAPRNRRTEAIGLWAYRQGAWSGHAYVEAARAREGFAPRSLGGFWRLTGSEPDSLRGRSSLFARWVLARELLALAPVLGSAVRGGFSLELGGAFAADQAIRLGDMRPAASAFVSADTRLGPLYLGAGGTRGSQPRLYLFLGPIW